MKIGDKVLFKNYSRGFHRDNIKWYTDSNGIPKDYIKHGRVVLRDAEEGGIIEAFYEEYVIVSYIDDGGKKVQVGFLPDSLILKESIEPHYEIY